MKNQMTVLIVIAVLAGLFFMMGPFYIVEEGTQAVVVRFGQIVDIQREAGLKFKMPMLDTVVTYPKRILSWDGEAQRIPTRENQFIWVDATARWRIVDPARFYASITTVNTAYGRLDDIIDSTVRTTISANYLREAVRNSNIINEARPIDEQQVGLEIDQGIQDLARYTTIQVHQDEISKGRRRLSEEMLAAAGLLTPDFGIEIIDIVIRQIRYSDDLTQSVYNRMIAERNQIAQAYRSFGEGRKKEWLGRLENERRTILSRAYEEAETIKGQADAIAARIYSEAYSADPSFFEFWRAMESYRTTLPRFRKMLTTDMDYFRHLHSPTP